MPTAEQRGFFDFWINTLAGDSASGIFGWLYSLVPTHGRYSGNGINDAWVVWQAYNNVFGNGSNLTRDQFGVDMVRDLMNDYNSRFPNDPLNIMPREPADWNSFFHDMFSFGGIVPEVMNHLTFLGREFTDFLNGADLFHLFSGPFIAVFGTAATVVSEAFGWATNAASEFGGSILDFAQRTWDDFTSFSLSDFVNSVRDFIGDVRRALEMVTELEMAPGRSSGAAAGDAADPGSNLSGSSSGMSDWLNEIVGDAQTLQSAIVWDDAILFRDSANEPDPGVKDLGLAGVIWSSDAFAAAAADHQPDSLQFASVDLSFTRQSDSDLALV